MIQFKFMSVRTTQTLIIDVFRARVWPTTEFTIQRAVATFLSAFGRSLYCKLDTGNPLRNSTWIGRLRTCSQLRSLSLQWSHYLVTLDRNKSSPFFDGAIISCGVGTLPQPQKKAGDQDLHDLLHRHRQLKTFTTTTQDFVLAILCSGQKAEVLRDLNTAFPCIPELETFRSVLDNKT